MKKIYLCELRAAYPDIHFLFDTKMAAFHEELELLYEPEYDWLWKEGHIRHYHVNDYAGGYMEWANLSALPVGTVKPVPVANCSVHVPDMEKMEIWERIEINNHLGETANILLEKE